MGRSNAASQQYGVLTTIGGEHIKPERLNTEKQKAEVSALFNLFILQQPLAAFEMVLEEGSENYVRMCYGGFVVEDKISGLLSERTRPD
jgi:hypothetical protein